MVGKWGLFTGCIKIFEMVMEHAVSQEDGTFPLVVDALCITWGGLGYDKQILIHVVLVVGV